MREDLRELLAKADETRLRLAEIELEIEEIIFSKISEEEIDETMGLGQDDYVGNWYYDDEENCFVICNTHTEYSVRAYIDANTLELVKID